MRLIVISNPTIVQNEHEVIDALFERGLEYFHVRKPEFSREELKDFIKGISPKYLKRVVVHSHYQLIENYNLKGIHLTGNYLNEVDREELRILIKNAQKRNLSVSTSVHNIEEFDQLGAGFDYVFLSPVFDSISKEDYKSSLEKGTLNELLKKDRRTKIIALGGIDEMNIEEVKAMGFDGCALLGAIWHDLKPNAVIDKFVRIKNRINN